MNPTDPPPVLLDPERALIGCLMRMPVPDAAELLGWVQPEDLTDPAAGAVLGWIRTLVATQRAPEPLAVFEYAREHGDNGPPSGWAGRLARIGRWVLDTYHDAPPPDPGHGRWLAGLVLKAAWRQAVAEHAVRVGQAVEQYPARDLRRIATDTHRAEDLWRRYQTIAGDPTEHHTSGAGGGIGVAA